MNGLRGRRGIAKSRVVAGAVSDFSTRVAFASAGTGPALGASIRTNR